jgi:hypothetical protein
MALSTGNPHISGVDYRANTAGGVSFVDVDFAANGAGALASPDAYVPIYNGEWINVYGLEILTAGTATADLDVGPLTAAGAAGDVDGFIDGANVDGAAGTIVAANGVLSLAGGYVNASGATQYLAGTNLIAENATGKVRIFYEKKSLPIKGA